MTTAKLTSTFRYTGAGDQSTTTSFNVETPDYAAVNAGKIDYAGDATGSQDVPFGTVDKPVGVVIKNSSQVSVEVTLAPFDLAPGGVVMIVHPTGSTGGAPLTGASVLPQATQSGTASIDYIIVGD